MQRVIGCGGRLRSGNENPRKSRTADCRRTVGWGECNEPQHVCGDDVYVGVRELTPTYGLQRIAMNYHELRMA